MRLVYLPLGVALSASVDNTRNDPWGPQISSFVIDRPDDYVHTPNDRNAGMGFNQTYGVNCGTMKDVNRVVGGWEVDLQDHPWQVFFQGCDKRRECSSCGASIIAPRWALTAAHCLDGAEPTTTRIRTGFIMGLEDLDAFTAMAGNMRQRFWRDAVELIPHGMYNKKTGKDDIGLVKNDKTWIEGANSDFSDPTSAQADRIFPICLPQKDFCLQRDTSLMATGWGDVDDRETETRVLRGVYLPLLQLAECRIHHGASNRKPVWKNNFIDESMTCAGAQAGRDTCQGDSGGPLIFRDANEVTTLYGATSWGIGCGRAGFPGVYARVSYYRSWIFKYAGVNLEGDESTGEEEPDTTCRDFSPNFGIAAPPPAKALTLFDNRNLITGKGMFDTHCAMKAVNPIKKGEAVKKGEKSFNLVFKDAHHCNPEDPNTQWENPDGNIATTGGVIKQVGQENCWTFNLHKEKADMTVRPCDGKGWQKFIWYESTGELQPKRDAAKNSKNQQVLRAYADGKIQTVIRKKLPSSASVLLPGLSAENPTAPGTVKAGNDVMPGYCIAKKPGNNLNRRPLITIKCPSSPSARAEKAEWEYDFSTKQIKLSSNTNYCWAANPRRKKFSNIRLAKCNKSRKGDMKWISTTDGTVSPFNNRKLIVQMKVNKKLQAVDKYDKGFITGFGDGHPTIFSEPFVSD